MENFQKSLEKKLGKISWHLSVALGGDYIKSFETFETSLILSNLKYAFFFRNAKEEDFHSTLEFMDEYSRLDGFDIIEELKSSSTTPNTAVARKYSNRSFESNIGICIFSRPHLLRVIYYDAYDIPRQ